MLDRNRILAVDDNPTNLAIVEEIFQGRFDLRLVQSGNEALELAPTFQPDVVLLDVMMPRPDGYEVCSRMKNDPRLRHCQVIMVSARTDIEERVRGYRAGADDYVTRPFEEQELCAKVDAHLRTKSIYGTVCGQIDALCGATGEALELISHLRDAETGEHLDRIRVYSHLLAVELRRGPLGGEIDSVFLDDLYRASPLHDIGKIAIGDAILRKPGPLTNEERVQMQQHTIIGEQILRRLAQRQPDIGFFRMAAEIARWHHECFDGSGYPDGLCGTEIPLAARIVRVADVFDAMTSARVYKPSYEPTIVRDEMAGAEAAKSDPSIIEAMLNVFDELEHLCRSLDRPDPSPLAITSPCAN